MTSLQPGSCTSQVGLRRPAFFELPLVCRMLTEAFRDEPMFGDFIHPYRHEYPDDPALWWLKRFRKSYHQPNEVFLVSVDEGLRRENKDYITGVARWTRHGGKEELQRLGWATSGWWDIRNILHFLASTYANICSWLYPNRAAMASRENILQETAHFSDHYWDGSRSSHWYLDLLGVHPSYRKKGVGRALVTWGINQARQEGVACSVISSFGNDDFYRRCGFDTFVGRAGEGEDNPIKNVLGGNIWFRDFQNDAKQDKTQDP